MKKLHFQRDMNKAIKKKSAANFDSPVQ